MPPIAGRSQSSIPRTHDGSGIRHLNLSILYSLPPPTNSASSHFQAVLEPTFPNFPIYCAPYPPIVLDHPTRVASSILRLNRSDYHSRYYCSTSSTRLFFALPSLVLLLATGANGPTPCPFKRFAAIPYLPVSSLTTDCALASESF